MSGRKRSSGSKRRSSAGSRGSVTSLASRASNKHSDEVAVCSVCEAFFKDEGVHRHRCRWCWRAVCGGCSRDRKQLGSAADGADEAQQQAQRVCSECAAIAAVPRTDPANDACDLLLVACDNPARRACLAALSSLMHHVPTTAQREAGSADGNSYYVGMLGQRPAVLLHPRSGQAEGPAQLLQATETAINRYAPRIVLAVAQSVAVLDLLPGTVAVAAHVLDQSQQHPDTAMRWSASNRRDEELLTLLSERPHTEAKAKQPVRRLASRLAPNMALATVMTGAPLPTTTEQVMQLQQRVQLMRSMGHPSLMQSSVACIRGGGVLSAAYLHSVAAALIAGVSDIDGSKRDTAMQRCVERIRDVFANADMQEYKAAVREEIVVRSDAQVDAGAAASRAVPAVLMLALKSAPQLGMDMLRLCAFTEAERIPKSLLKRLPGADVEAAYNEAMIFLKQATLMQDSVPGCVSVHRVVQDLIAKDAAVGKLVKSSVQRGTVVSLMRTAVASFHRARPTSWPAVAELVPHAMAVAVDAENTADLAELMDTVGVYLLESGQGSLAEDALELALNATSDVHGKDSAAHLRVVVHQGEAVLLQGDSDEAKMILQETLEQQISVAGKTSVDVAATRIALAKVYEAGDDAAAAQREYTTAESILVAALGDADIMLIQPRKAVAEIAYGNGATETAVRGYESVLAIQQAAFGKESKAVAPTLLRLGQLAVARGDVTQAKALLQRALAIHQAIDGVDHSMTQRVRNALSRLDSVQNAGKQDAQPAPVKV